MKTSLTNERQISSCRIAKLFATSVISASLVCAPIISHAAVITTDPALTAAIIAQTELLEDQYKKRNKLRESTLMVQGAISVGLERIHELEKKVLDYMGNASGVLTNLIQIKNIAEYATKISSQLVEIGKSIPDNPKGAAITAVCNRQIQQTSADVVGMTDLVRTLVTTKYSLKDGESTENKKHVNLLTSAERYNILVSVEQKLSKISYDLMLIQYFIKTLSWRDLWMGLDRESYLRAISMQIDVNSIINKWNKLSTK